MDESWQSRVDAVWADPGLDGPGIIAAIDAIAAERPPDDAVALFERAGARDTAGREAEAEPLYRAALARGLDEDRRVQAVIQLASTIRNLGKTDEALETLAAEYDRQPPGPWRDAVAAFYALALVSAGDPVRGAAVSLSALAPHLPRYTRSVSAYARELLDGDT